MLSYYTLHNSVSKRFCYKGFNISTHSNWKYNTSYPGKLLLKLGYHLQLVFSLTCITAIKSTFYKKTNTQKSTLGKSEHSLTKNVTVVQVTRRHQ